MLARGTYKCFGKKGIVIDSMEDFEIDGMGATLVFRRPSDFSILPQYAVVENDSNFLVKNCKRVKISNINSDWDWETDPLGAFVRIISKHPAEGGTPPYFDVEFIGYDRYPLYGKPTPVQVMMPMADSMDSFGMGAAFGLARLRGTLARNANGSLPIRRGYTIRRRRKGFRCQARTTACLLSLIETFNTGRQKLAGFTA